MYVKKDEGVNGKGDTGERWMGEVKECERNTSKGQVFNKRECLGSSRG